MRLRQIAFSGSYPKRIALRAHIILLLAEGRTPGEIEFELKTSKKTIRKWRKRYNNHGVEGILHEAPRSGRKKGDRVPSVDEVVDVIQGREPPKGDQWGESELAMVCNTSQSRIHRLVKLHHIPLSRDGLRMMLFNRSRHPISDIPGYFLSPTLKAVTFQMESEGCEVGFVPSDGIVAHDIDEVARPSFEGHPPVTGPPASIHLMMVRTDAPGTFTHLQIPVLQNGAPRPSDNIDLSPKAVAFYHYKVLELGRAMGDAMREMGAGAPGNGHDLDMLVFLECIERRVPRDKEVSLVMNSPAHDANDRVLLWRGRHPRFRMEFFKDDGLWLDMVVEKMNGIPDEYKRRVTFRLEYMLAEIAERGGERGRPIFSFGIVS